MNTPSNASNNLFTADELTLQSTLTRYDRLDDLVSDDEDFSVLAEMDSNRRGRYYS